MECTQRLECTQELHGTQSERINPEQIGFLGILGNKYPVNRGPNKIGRDPQTCSIILNLNSVSRQHAVLNILNKKDFMLMDLDSANKTKLSGKSLQPYIPHPISDGDTVQFGEIFGVFRLLEDDNELPMTQALDIPDTPMPTKHVSRVNAVTTIPESPDVSDRDDSFIVPSQPKGLQLKNKTQHYIKPGKTISIQPIGSNKIDNVFWNSSKKSTSLNLDDSDRDFNDSIPSVKLKEKENNANDIHDLETQQFLPENNCPENESPESIYRANTQIPGMETGSIYAANTQLPGSPSIHSLNTQLPGRISSPSIHSLNTQMPGAFGSPSIHNLDTQVPGVLPDVCKINDQQDMQIDLIAKENDVYDGETQDYMFEKENIPISTNLDSASKKLNKSKMNISDEEVLFDEFDNGLVEELESQAILTEDYELPINKALNDSDPMSQIHKPNSAKRNLRIQSDESQAMLTEDIELPVNKVLDESDPISQIVKPTCAKRNMRIQSDDATDCEDDIDILPTQVIPKLPDEDETDCEETTESKSPQKINNQISKDDIDDEATQDLDFDYYNAPPIRRDVKLEDMPTQVLHNENVEVVQNKVAENDNFPTKTKELDFEDMPTQVLETDNIEKVPVVQNLERKEVTLPIDFEDLATQVLEEDVTVNKSCDKNQFSEEMVVSPFKVPSNSAVKSKKKEKLLKLKPISDLSKNVVNDNYYQCTQDVFEELCTQRIDSPKLTNKNNVPQKSPVPINVQSPKYQRDEDVNKSVSKMSMHEIREKIGVNSPVAKPVKVPSDGSTSSDLEITPKKSRLLKFISTDLPNSQEIKTGVSYTSKLNVTESSSDSETDKNIEEQNTPIVHRRTKKKSNSSGLLNVSKKLDVENLPKRVLTRPRKPTAKFLEAQNNSILKPKYLTGQEDNLDEEIITENISRLRNEMEKSKLKSNKDPNQIKQEEDTKERKSETVNKERVSTKKSDSVIKVKIERPEAKKYSSKDKKRSKKEPNNNKKERTSKSSNTSKDVSKLDSTLESSATHSLIKSILQADITMADTISPIRTRSKRAAQNTKIVKTEDQKSCNETKDEAPERPNRSALKRNRTKKQERKSPSLVKEVRRSRRQKTKEEPVKVKSILKKNTLEQSVVYNNSGSNSDSPRSLKRPALDDSDEPSSKRIRQANNLSLRATPARMARTQYVLFTAFPVEEVKDKLESLGAVIVTDVMKCTVLLTLEVKRTFKLLCAVGLGKPIVGPNWVQACADTNTIVDPWLYIIRNEVTEKRFQFSLQQTLTGRRNFLHGYNVSSTPSVMPNQFEMKYIVECSGGTWKEGGPKWLCVTCSKDRHLWPALNKLGATLVTTELILGGVLRQKLEIEANKVHLAK